MATTREKISFYLSPEKATSLRAIALEQRRTVTAILETATDQIIAEHVTNGLLASSSRKREQATQNGG